jgi:ketosteroid isomerase-like protein
MSTTERLAFLESTLDGQLRAEVALHNGDVGPRRSTWSHDDPVTVFGAGVFLSRGWQEVSEVFDRVAADFVACDDYDFELVAAEAAGDLAYTVGVERYRATKADGEVVQTTLRVTHVYRREAGEWKIVHRHGDHAAEEPRAG